MVHMEPDRDDAAITWSRMTGAQLGVFKALERALVSLGNSVPQALALETQSVTGLLDRMEQRGSVQRVRDLHDRQALRLGLLPAGEAVLGEAADPTEATL